MNKSTIDALRRRSRSIAQKQQITTSITPTNITSVPQVLPNSIPCRYLGDPNGELVDCPTCPGLSKDGSKTKTRIKTFSCNIYGMCTIAKPVGTTKCCASCISYKPVEDPTIPKDLSERKDTLLPIVDLESPVPSSDSNIEQTTPILNGVMAQEHSTALVHSIPYSPTTRVHWAYGVTTISSRFSTTLMSTLAQLAKAGFDSPTIFADDCTLQQAITLEEITKLEVVPRRRHHQDQPGIAWSNYLLALYDLCIRNRNATRVVLFQDDISCPVNLKHYLSSITYPEKGYWNLYTGDQNELLANTHFEDGWFRSDQMGRGALALVFDRDTVERLLGHITTSQRARSAKLNWVNNIDGWVQGVLVAQLGYTEYCHKPGLVQHRGVGMSTMGSKQIRAPKCYIGDSVNCLDLLKK